MEQLFIIADKKIFKVRSLCGHMIYCIDSTGWDCSIPITRVDRFCDSKGKHIDFKIDFKID